MRTLPYSNIEEIKEIIKNLSNDDLKDYADQIDYILYYNQNNPFEIVSPDIIDFSFNENGKHYLCKINDIKNLIILEFEVRGLKIDN